tara:strand:+ start:362 stop:652 length:291 start_codon:yes stop_codon:yes gene_type:complete
MKEKDRISLIRKAVANATTEVPAQFKELVDNLKAEKLAEELVINHGLLVASDEEVQEEFVSLDSVKEDKDDDDFEADENLVDMDQVSDSMREIFGE